MKKSGNIRALIIFEVLYKAAFILVAYYAFFPAVRLMLKITGYSYLTLENLKSVLLHPVSLVFIFLFLTLGAVVYLIEAVSLIIFFQGFLRGEKLRVAQIIIPGIRETKLLLQQKSRVLLWLYALINEVFFLIPVAFILCLQMNFSPSLIKNFFRSHMGLPAVAIILVLFAVLRFFGAFLLHYMVLGDLDGTEAWGHSQKLFIRNWKKILFRYLLCNGITLIICALLFVIVLFAGCFAVYSVKPAKVCDAAVLVTYDYIFFIVGMLSVVVFQIVNHSLFSSFFSIHGIVNLTHSRIKELQEELVYEELEWQILDEPRNRGLGNKFRKYSVITFLFGFCVFIFGGLSMLNALRNGSLAEKETLFGTYITSHRGASFDAPENTIPAIEKAIESYADYVEIDLQETKDGRIVLMHDTSLFRTTGNKDTVSNLTLEQLQHLDAGSWFSPEFAGTRIPTVEEVFEQCKGRISLNIELKADRNMEKNTRLVKKIVELISEYDMENQCVVSSTNYRMLEVVKEINPRIPTGYILSFAIGNVKEKDSVDFYSVRAGFLSEKFVIKAHEAGKEVHAWTVNTRTEMERMKRYGVDNIITDKPLLAREVLYSDDVKSGFLRIMKELVQKVFRFI